MTQSRRPRSAEARSYSPTIREWARNWLVGDRRPSVYRDRLITGVTGDRDRLGLLDFTPIGPAMAVQEASRRNDPASAKAMAVLPGSRLAGPRLSVLHNLSADNLRFSDKLGGIPVPSLGVVREGMGIEGFGEITMIGRKHLGDPERVPYFDRDVYSPRAPRPIYGPASSRRDGPVDKFVDDLRRFEKTHEKPGATGSQAWHYLVENPDPKHNANSLMRSEAMRALYLESIGKPIPKPVMRDASLRNDWVGTEAFKRFIRENGYDPNFSDGGNYHRALTDAARAGIRERAEQLSQARSGDRGEVDYWVDKISGHTLNNEGLLSRGATMWLGDDVRKLGTKEVDPGKTRERMEKAIRPHQVEFERWVEKTVFDLHPDPKIKVDGRKVPITLDNMVEAMSGRIEAQEKTLTVSDGLLAASNANRFSSLEHMRNAADPSSPWGMKPKAEVDEIRDQAGKRLMDWREAVQPYYKYSDAWHSFDDATRALIAAGKNPTRATLRSGLARNSFRDVPGHLLDEGLEARQGVVSAPVPYFEGKPQRGVTLDEFAGAVIPRKSPPEVREILSRHGIETATYANTTRDAQSEAAAKLTRSLARKGQDTLFTGPVATATGAAIAASVATRSAEVGSQGSTYQRRITKGPKAGTIETVRRPKRRN